MRNTRISKPAPRFALFVAVCAAAVTCSCAGGQKKFHPRAVEFQARGAEQLVQGDVDRAAGLFSLALDYEPRMFQAENGLGLVARARGDRKLAEASFRRALDLEDDFAEAHVNLGALLYDSDDIENAAEHFQRALAIDPGYGAARLAAGLAKFRLGRLSEAHWDLRKMCEIEPLSARAHAALAVVLVRLTKIADADEAARRALSLDEKLALGHRARGEIRRTTGDLPGAESDLRHAVMLEPGDPDHRLALATVLIAREQYEPALMELHALSTRTPRRAEIPFALAFVHLRRANWDDAARAARRALALRPHYPEARLLLAESLMGGGHVQAGHAELRVFIAEAPAVLASERKRAESLLAAR